MILDPMKMPEAEVTLRLGLYLIRKGLAASDASAAIDGAQVRTGTRIHFPIVEFLQAEGLTPVEQGSDWRGAYSVPGSKHELRIHSSPGQGDLVCRLRDGRRLRVECKKGTLNRSNSSQEYPLLREAIGQIMTIEDVSSSDTLAVAVPASEKFRQLAARWRQAPLIEQMGLRILLVDRSGHVEGLT